MCHMSGSPLVPIQVLQLADPEMNDTSTKRLSANCTQSFAIIANDCLHDGLNYLMDENENSGWSRERDRRRRGKTDKERGDAGGV